MDKNKKKKNKKYEGKCALYKSEIWSLSCLQVQHNVVNSMYGYLQFSTNSTAKAILSSIFWNIRSAT